MKTKGFVSSSLKMKVQCTIFGKVKHLIATLNYRLSNKPFLSGSLYTQKKQSNFDSDAFKILQQISSTIPENNDEVPPIHIDQINKVLSKIRPWKACGVDQTYPYFWKHLRSVRQPITNVMQKLLCNPDSIPAWLCCGANNSAVQKWHLNRRPQLQTNNMSEHFIQNYDELDSSANGRTYKCAQFGRRATKRCPKEHARMFG